MTADTAILSFHSRVAFGRVGHAVAEFCLQRLGYDVWPIDTVNLSTHPGLAAPVGHRRTAAEARQIFAALDGLGLTRRAAALLSGYLGRAEIADVVLQARARLPAAVPFACDPVIGDRDRGVYVEADLVPLFRHRLAPAAQLLTPNHFELELLVERPLPTLAEVIAAAERFVAGAARLVVVGSLAPPLVPPGRLGTVAVGREGRFLVTTPAVPATVRGTGDLLTALVLARWLNGQAVAELLSDAVSATYAVIAATVSEGAPALRLIAHQELLLAPPVRYPALRLD